MWLTNILATVGNTPLIKIENEPQINLYVKLEGMNPTGSIKDRAAAYLLPHLLETGTINQNTTIIESSSGNFGIALSAYCKQYGIKFICVVDPKILPINEFLIRSYGAQVEKVTECDEAGGYLLTRIKRVLKLCDSVKNSYWINQYSNTLNAQAYNETVGLEICRALQVDYIFIGVSSGGTIAGVSQCVKRWYANAKVVAVDIAGSIIFGGKADYRFIPGIGSSMVPEILKEAAINDVVIVTENESARMCRILLKEHGLFVGGSSGSVYAGIKKYFEKTGMVCKPNVVAIFADRGDRYIDTVYNDEWCKNNLEK